MAELGDWNEWVWVKRILSSVRFIHDRFVSRRRSRILAQLLAELIPSNATVLDVGCGNGEIAQLISQFRLGVSIRGAEIMPRSDCVIECMSFDGKTLPTDDSAVDVCMLVDVLHHTLDSSGLLKEAGRVTKRHVLVKDHLCENGIDKLVLSFMDWIGNRPHGVCLPYNYQSRTKRDQHFSSCGFIVMNWRQDIPLYPFPFNIVFGRHLHFTALLEKSGHADPLTCKARLYRLKA